MVAITATFIHIEMDGIYMVVCSTHVLQIEVTHAEELCWLVCIVS